MPKSVEVENAQKFIEEHGANGIVFGGEKDWLFPPLPQNDKTQRLWDATGVPGSSGAVVYLAIEQVLGEYNKRGEKAGYERLVNDG